MEIKGKKGLIKSKNYHRKKLNPNYDVLFH